MDSVESFPLQPVVQWYMLPMHAWGQLSGRTIKVWHTAVDQLNYVQLFWHHAIELGRWWWSALNRKLKAVKETHYKLDKASFIHNKNLFFDLKKNFYLGHIFA
jgi:hypothetical protein